METAINLSLSALAVMLGLFVMTSPTRAAEIWGWSHLNRLAPKQKTLYLRWYRTFGIVLCLGGMLFALDSITFSQYHH
jgi:hypothetical protein